MLNHVKLKHMPARKSRFTQLICVFTNQPTISM